MTKQNNLTKSNIEFMLIMHNSFGVLSSLSLAKHQISQNLLVQRRIEEIWLEQALFCHHKVFAGPFSHQTQFHTYFTQYCDLVDL